MLASDSICGKSQQPRGEVNKKGKNHANDLKFSKSSLFTELHKLYSSSLCWFVDPNFVPVHYYTLEI